MPRCASCGSTSAPANARFCPVCGSTIAPAASSAGTPSAASAASRGATGSSPYASAPTGMSNQAKLAIGGGVALAAIAGFLLAKAGLLSSRSPETPQSGLLAPPTTRTVQGPVLAAPQTSPNQAPVLAAPQPTAPNAPVLQPPPTSDNPMPEDIIAYLRWLKWFEGNLHKLADDAEAVGISVIPDLYLGAMNQITADDNDKPAPTGKPGVTERLNSITQQMNSATALFQQRVPPNACAPLAMSYNRKLTTEVQQIATLTNAFGKIAQTFNNGVDQGGDERQNMLPGLMKELQSKNMSRTADQDAAAAGEALNSLRARYTQIPTDIDATHFQIGPLDSGMDPGKFLKGMPGAGGGL